MNLIKNMLPLPDFKLNKADTLLKKSLLPLLEKNQVVDAKVLKLISPSKAELLILGKKVVADTSESSNLAKANLAKGDTIQLKVTDQGHLNILKVIPEKVLPQNTASENLKTSAQPAMHSASSLKTASLNPNLNSTTAVNSNISKHSNSAIQFFAKNQPFEGFTKLAAALFSNLKELTEKKFSVITNTTPQKVLVKNLSEQFQTDKSSANNLTNQVHTDKASANNLINHLQTDKPVMDKADIKNLLMSVALKSGKTDVDFLPRLLQKSGILMESKLADMLKSPASLSTEIYSNSASDSPKVSSPLSYPTPPSPSSFIQEDIKGAVLNFIANSGFEASESLSLNDIHSFQEFVQNLENVQLLNSHLSESGKYIIPFPLFSGDQFSFGQLLIDLGNKDKDDEKGSSKENSLLKVSLFLDMTNLGPVRADFSVLKNNITGGFQVSDQETANFFNSMLSELKERLQTHQFNVHKIECRMVEPEKLAEKSIINELLKSEDHGLSLMI